MARRHMRVGTLLLAVALFVLSTGPVWATFQLWKIDQIYSNTTANVQFVELADTADGELNVMGQTLTSNGQTFTFPSDLPDGTATAGSHMLLATPGYFALAGVAKADFMLPDHFFNAVGDMLTYAGGLDSVTFDNFQVPVDNLHSLNRSSPGAPLLSGVNSPTDVHGDTGQIPSWENQDNPLDVDGNGKVQAHDVALLINDLLANGIHPLADRTSGNTLPPFLDVDGDNSVKPADVNTVITFLLDNPPSAVVPMAALSPPAMSMVSATIQSVPEPASDILALCGAGLLGFIGVRQRTAAPDARRRWAGPGRHVAKLFRKGASHGR
jgi:dockerin type I repeat protein